jgi:NCAIR mutase (PurE)-related protein
MDPRKLKELLSAVASGKRSVAKALDELTDWPAEDLGFARVDHHRHLRQGFPEVVYAPGKTAVQVAAIARRLVRSSGVALVTRLDASGLRALRATRLPVRWSAAARCAVVGRPTSRRPSGDVLVMTAGTADISVAEEAAVTAGLWGARVERIFDVGVAGVHRLLAHQAALRRARCIVVAAGMEGALASVVGGLAACPVIAVPTSAGYGAAFGGVAALLAMLNSCAPNVLTVNIDDGFGAGYSAGLIARREG